MYTFAHLMVLRVMTMSVFSQCAKLVTVNGEDWYETQLGVGDRDMFTLDLISIGITFRKVEGVGSAVERRVGKLAVVSPPLTRDKARRVAGAACPGSPQLIHEILTDYSWAAALALDSSFLDDIQLDVVIVRLRVAIDCDVHSMHLAAVPLFATHTASDVVEAVTPLYDAVDDDWRLKLTGCASDGENKMTGIHVGVATQFEQETRRAGSTDEFFRLWDPCHQLDLALHRALDALSGLPNEEVRNRVNLQVPAPHPTNIHYMKRLRETATTMRYNKLAINARRTRDRRGNCPGTLVRDPCCRFTTCLLLNAFVSARGSGMSSIR
eukprot:GHVU01011167.1.p1 GENE.GHVU01011167.1~~GHVU01011167.1.p1  ORF type:complete len:324 (-),score=38.12 GHVU01011167.1:1192-2163(-)